MKRIPILQHVPKVTSRTYLLAIEGPLFRRQRQLLLELTTLARNGRSISLGEDQVELLVGLVNLTDAIADQAHDEYRIDCLLRSGDRPLVTEPKTNKET